MFGFGNLKTKQNELQDKEIAKFCFVLRNHFILIAVVHEILTKRKKRPNGQLEFIYLEN